MFISTKKIEVYAGYDPIQNRSKIITFYFKAEKKELIFEVVVYHFCISLSYIKK